jgi:glycosyltransferase involved in cell wall biosynthesis
MEKEGIATRYAPALIDAYVALANDVAEDDADLASRIRGERERFEKSGMRSSRLARSALRGLTGPATFLGSKISLGRGASPALPVSADISPRVRSDRYEAREQPLVTVVIPAYNRAETIRRSVDSVLQQDYRTIELLVVDDASSDGTLNVLRQQPDPRLRVIRQPSNRGVGAARNRGIREARGGFIAFLDSDDEWLPGKLAKQIAVFENAPGRVGMIVTGVENRFKDGATAIQRAHRNGGWFETLLLRNTLHGAPSSGVFRREVFEVVGGFDPRLPAIEDYELWLRISRFFDIASIDEPLVRYFDMADFSDSRSDAMRVSRNFNKNRTARRILFERYGFEMKRRGVDHLFLLDSSMRELADPAGSKMRAAIQATKAIARRPLAPYSYRWLLTQFAPRLLGN